MADRSTRSLAPMQLTGNLKENWRKWRQYFEIYCVATEIEKKAEKVKCAILLHYIGEECIDIYNTFGLSPDEQKVDIILQKFENYFVPKSSETYERYKFFTRSQHSETIDQYVTQLKKLSENCEFGDLKNSLIRDRLICGIKDNKVREELLRNHELTLEKAVEICRASEMSAEQAGQIAAYSGTPTGDDEEICLLRRKGRLNTTGRKPSVCKYCGSVHEYGKCPAYGSKCYKCNKLNHFASQCKSRSVNMVNVNESKIYNENDDIFIGELKITGSDKDWTSVLTINSKDIKFKLDTGAQVNCLPKTIFDKLNLNSKLLFKTNKNLITYSNDKLDVVGTCFLKCLHNNIQYMLEFYVVNVESIPVLGIDACKKLNLIQRVSTISQIDKLNSVGVESILSKYKQLFEGMGLLKIKPVKITLKDNARPVVHAARKIPFAIKDDLKSELNNLEKLNIIKKVTEPTDWVNSLVIVRKSNGKLRFCIDPSDLNNNIAREYFQIPTLDDIMSNLNGAKYFSVLDASNGFWQMPIDESSSKLCTFNTPFGRYRFLRLPFGLSCAPEIFQRQMVQFIDDIEGVVTYFDDVLIFAKSVEEHNSILERVLERFKKFNLKLNKSKSKFCVTKIKYLGHIISNNGITADDEKIKAINSMQKPVDKTSLQRFLGMITYLGRFINNLSDKTAPLRQLLQKENAWVWDHAQEKAFELLKKEICSCPVLKYYDVKKDVTISVDASRSGVGAVLLQEGSPIAYASKSLTNTQTRWAQIEKELYAICFGCERFSQYIKGKTVTVQTDHQPLLSIFAKSIVDCPLRLQRMILRLQHYDIKLIYVPGCDLKIADTLSRAYVTEIVEDDDLEQEVDAHVYLLLKNFEITDQQLLNFQNMTNNDSELQLLKNYIRNGWPADKRKIENSVKFYYNFRNELSEYSDLVFRNKCIIVPKLLRKEMLEKIHFNHLGINKCLARGRKTFFWPGMSNDIKNIVKQCTACKVFQNSQRHEPILFHEIPEHPWKKLGLDVFNFDNHNYLLTIDYYSKYVEVTPLNSLSSKELIKHCKNMFGRLGIPDCVVSDNGTNFSSREFEEFANLWNFKIITSSPRYPQSNGMVERHIQTVKNMLKKGKLCKQDLNLILLEYRNTPIDNRYSPAELLFGRSLQGILPNIQTKINHKKYKSFQNNKKEIEKFYYNRGSRPLSELERGDRVFVQMGNKWEPGEIVDKANRPRSYKINLDISNGTIERNRRFITINPAEKSNRLSQQFNDNFKIKEEPNDGIMTRSGFRLRPIS